MRFAITLFLAVAIGGLSHADQIAIIRADLPGPIPHEAPIALQGLREGIVLLDLRIAPELEPSVVLSDGRYGSLEGCEFGPVDAKTVVVGTGSNHMILEVRMGNSDLHAANLVSCNYDSALITESGTGHMTRVKGCFLAHAVSIPTAVHWRLNPLPAEACGFGD